MGSIPTQLEVEVYIHATESVDKVINSLIDLLTTNAPIIIEVLYGHYGNPIYKVSSVIKDEELTMKIITRLCSSMTNRNQLMETISARVNSGGNIFIRLDKQEFVQGHVVLSDGDDVVRIKVKVMLDNNGQVSPLFVVGGF